MALTLYTAFQCLSVCNIEKLGTSGEVGENSPAREKFPAILLATSYNIYIIVRLMVW